MKGAGPVSAGRPPMLGPRRRLGCPPRSRVSPARSGPATRGLGLLYSRIFLRTGGFTMMLHLLIGAYPLLLGLLTLLLGAAFDVVAPWEGIDPRTVDPQLVVVPVIGGIAGLVGFAWWKRERRIRARQA